MRVGWFTDPCNADGIRGGAELTQAEFRATSPEGVEVVEVGPSELEKLSDCEVVCVFNSVSYPAETVEALEGRRVVRYWNDLAPHGDPSLKVWFLHHATNLFCSPLHHERFPWREHLGPDYGLVPPPVDLERFRTSQNGSERLGVVSVGLWENHAKAPYLALEWARGELDFYGGGPFAPPGSVQVDYENLPKILARYRTFVFLPIGVEPFGRCVVEAWASGCEVVTNRLVGARYWIEERSDKLETASEEFWGYVCG